MGMFLLSMIMHINQIYSCRVIKLNPTFALLSYQDTIGICHISEISDYHISDIKVFLTVNKNYDFLLITSDNEKQKYSFSFKRIRPKLLKSHNGIIPTKSGYNNLYKHTLKLLEQ
jgi:predicted RNA-binding protein with RPS1 domain